MAEPWFALVESNTTGSGRQFCRAALSRGHLPVVLTTAPERYAYLTEDGVPSVVCDTSDPDVVLGVCRTLADSDGLAGVASSSEYFAALAARVATRLGLPAADADALDRCRHKDEQRRLMSAAGVAIPGFIVATTPDEAADAARHLGPRVVVKPTTGSGSAGVRLCHDPVEAREWAVGLLAQTVNERGLPVPRVVLVEEYVDGPEFSVETFAGAVVAVVAKHVGPPPYFVETGHDVPAREAPVPVTDIAELAVRAVAALGVDWGAAHTELRCGPRGPVVIEVNPRLAGGMIPTLVQQSLGVDLVDCVVARSLGRAPDVTPRRAAGSAIRFVVAPDSGVLSGVDGLTDAVGLAGVQAVELTTPLGSAITITRSFRDRIGYVIAAGPDAASAGLVAQQALDLVKVVVSPR